MENWNWVRRDLCMTFFHAAAASESRAAGSAHWIYQVVGPFRNSFLIGVLTIKV